ncbi:FadR/GntR family transcriptional regulator [Peribacillus simplex]|uniref:FadR/GntR family transcriptional regulator n=1 Tax=Peribacillus simplex TaxID=1478 RepID=UPI00366DC96D
MDKEENKFDFFSKVEPVRGFDEVVRQIQEAISSGKFKVGERLPSERTLSEIFNISRPTIREAIRVLEAEKVVEVKKGVKGGAFIIEPGPDQIGKSLEALIRFKNTTVDEFTEFRLEFEGQTAYLAAERATTSQIESLNKIAKQIKLQAMDSNFNRTEYVKYDILFHEEVAYASNNQIRVAIMLGLHNAFHKMSIDIGDLENEEWQLRDYKDIEAIVHAISNRNPQLAKKKMEEHVQRNSEIMNIYKEQANN